LPSNAADGAVEPLPAFLADDEEEPDNASEGEPPHAVAAE
jgi:hypothetical protein